MELKSTMKETFTRLEGRVHSMSARAESTLRGVIPTGLVEAVDWKKVTPENLRAALRDARSAFAGHFRPVPAAEGSAGT